MVNIILKLKNKNTIKTNKILWVATSLSAHYLNSCKSKASKVINIYIRYEI